MDDIGAGDGGEVGDGAAAEWVDEANGLCGRVVEDEQAVGGGRTGSSGWRTAGGRRRGRPRWRG